MPCCRMATAHEMVGLDCTGCCCCNREEARLDPSVGLALVHHSGVVHRVHYHSILVAVVPSYPLLVHNLHLVTHTDLLAVGLLALYKDLLGRVEDHS